MVFPSRILGSRTDLPSRRGSKTGRLPYVPWLIRWCMNSERCARLDYCHWWFAMPENFAAVGALYEPASGAADVDDLFCLVAVWTFELDVFRSDRHLRFFHQARFFTSLRSLSVRFN